MTAERNPAMKLAISTSADAKFVEGRRAFFKYRDLGVKDASGGRMRAQLTSSEAGLSEPTGWHYHECEMQFVYILQGWVDVTGPNDPRFKSVIQQVTFFLFPPDEPQGDDPDPLVSSLRTDFGADIGWTRIGFK